MKTGSLRVACFLFRLYLAGLGASPGWISKLGKPWASALRLNSPLAFVLYLAGLGASPGWISKLGKPWASALRLNSPLAFVLYLAGLGASPGWISKSRSRTEAYFCRHGPLTGWF